MQIRRHQAVRGNDESRSQTALIRVAAAGSGYQDQGRTSLLGEVGDGSRLGGPNRNREKRQTSQESERAHEQKSKDVLNRRKQRKRRRRGGERSEISFPSSLSP